MATTSPRAAQAPLPIGRWAASASARWLYRAHRVLQKLSGGRASLHVYLFCAQPVGSLALASLRDDPQTRVVPIGPGEPLLSYFPRPQTVLAQRFVAGATCYAVLVKEQFAGQIWLASGHYDEDEVRCRYVLPDATTVWDFDVYIAPAFRATRAMARLWKGVDAVLQSRGVAWSCSRISLFNPGSVQTHERLGAPSVHGRLPDAGAGPAQLDDPARQTATDPRRIARSPADPARAHPHPQPRNGPHPDRMRSSRACPTSDGDIMSAHPNTHGIRSRQTLAAVLLAVIGATFTSLALAQSSENPCGAITSSYGPYDYRTDRNKLGIVEQYHFTPPVEALVRGATGTIAADLNYVLITFPNHHRALLAMMRLAEREKSPKAKGAGYSVDCYFDRALRFRSDDTVARLLFAQWLQKSGREANARSQLKATADLAGDNPFTHYNIGLAYLDMKAYDLALVHAQKAMALGFPRTELRDRLRADGKWADPVATTPSEAAASAASAASN